MSTGRFSRVGGLALMAAAFLLSPLLPAKAEAQGGGRMQVLVVDMKPSDESNTGFGEDASDELRDLLDLDTHIALSERETDQAARQYELRRSSLDCNTARQMSQLMSIPLVFCGEYRTEGEQIAYDGAFYTVPAGEEFRAGEAMVARNRPNEAAERFQEFFIETAERVAQIEYCGQQFRSSSWESAVQYCTEAIELSPNSIEARRALALALKELERYPESLVQFETILEAEPINSSMLENAGWVASQIGETAKARDFYARFLELNPDNTNVRISIARDLVEAQDEVGAVALLEDGFEHTADSTALINLNEQFGAVAFRAAQAEQNRRGPQAQAGPNGQRPPPPPEVAEYYRRAVRSFDYVLEHRGEETPPDYVRQSMSAWLQLQDNEQAVELGNRGLRYFPRDAQIMRLMAEAHNRSGRRDEAIARMNQALEVDPELRDARTLLGQWLLEGNDVDRGLAWIQRAAEAGEQTPDALAGILINHGWNRGVQVGNHALGSRMMTAAKEIQGISDHTRSQANFLHWYAIYDAAVKTAEAGTLAVAQATLPRFQESLGYLRAGEAYARESNQNYAELLSATETYIEIQEGIIQRGR